MSILNELDSQFSRNFSEASKVVEDDKRYPLFGEREGVRAQVQATLALAAATRMLVELLGTGAVVNVSQATR